MAARRLVPGPVVWSRQPLGDARGVRAFQQAGYRPVASETVLTAR
ncbi:hypothetical protein AB0903_19265 [Streptomyces sp. NPDC048389]